MELLLNGLAAVCAPLPFMLMTLGVLVGIIFGAIPGLSATTGVALCLPITFSMEPIPAFAFLCGIYVGGVSGGLISAILLNIPGAPASVATTFDGVPMARNGQAGKALGTGIVYSFLGGGISFIFMILVSPTLAAVAVKFGPCEFFALSVFALTLLGSLTGDSVEKGMLAALLGMAFALVGMAPIDGVTRYTFGLTSLNAGVNIMPILVGMFAVSELIDLAEKPSDLSDAKVIQNYKIRGFGFTVKEFIKQIPNFIRSTLIGLGVGILPGLGGVTSNMIAYTVAKKSSATPEKFGTGIMDGIVASEASNNASIGGAFIPLLALGIPGDAVTAILLGGFTLHGLVAGPLLFKTSGDIVYAVFAALLVSNVLMLVLEFIGLRVFVKILKVPSYYLLPVIFALCAVGAFSLNNRIFDIWVVLAFGVLAFFMRKGGIPSAPFILGFILGPMVETYLRRGYMLGDGSFAPFFTKPISCVFLILTAMSLVWGIVGPKMKARKVQKQG